MPEEKIYNRDDLNPTRHYVVYAGSSKAPLHHEAAVTGERANLIMEENAWGPGGGSTRIAYAIEAPAPAENTIIITRHKALVALIIERGLATPETPVIAHATEADVMCKHVIGVLPLSLAVLARSVTEIPMAIPAELRGVELTLEQCRQFAGETRKYAVLEISGFADGEEPWRYL